MLNIFDASSAIASASQSGTPITTIFHATATVAVLFSLNPNVCARNFVQEKTMKRSNVYICEQNLLFLWLFKCDRTFSCYYYILENLNFFVMRVIIAMFVFFFDLSVYMPIFAALALPR